MSVNSTSKAKANGGRRSSRLTSISNGQLHEQYKNRYRINGNGNGNSTTPNGNGNTVNGSATPLGFLGPRLSNLASEVEQRLETQTEKSGWSGNMARNMLERGLWLEEKLEEKINLRTKAIGGLDNMWLLLSSISNSNPACCATYTFKENVEFLGVENVVKNK